MSNGHGAKVLTPYIPVLKDGSLRLYLGKTIDNSWQYRYHGYD